MPEEQLKQFYVNIEVGIVEAKAEFEGAWEEMMVGLRVDETRFEVVNLPLPIHHSDFVFTVAALNKELKDMEDRRCCGKKVVDVTPLSDWCDTPIIFEDTNGAT